MGFIIRRAEATILEDMATLLLVRHGQASFGATKYDRLSPTGEEQSRRLGAYFAKMGQPFDVIYTGPRKRQIRTAEIAAEAMRENGLVVPDPVVVPDLDEVAAEDVIQEQLPRLLAESPKLQKLVQKLTSAGMSSRALDEVVAEVAGMWLRGELQADGLESWEDFSNRVERCLEGIIAKSSKGQRVIAFTSGGTIGASIRHVLGLDPERSLHLAQIIRNTSLTEVLFSGPRLTLASFNALPHLEPALITYR